MFKINRNPKHRIIENSAGTAINDIQHDNFSVQHQIPRSDRQYSWITGSLTDAALSLSNIRYWGYAPVTGPQTGYYYDGTEYVAYFDFVSASSVLGNSGTASIYQPALGLNYYVSDPVDELSDNTLGKSLSVINRRYANNALLSKYGIDNDLNLDEDIFNLLMTKRKNTFGYRGVPNTGPVQPSVIRKHRKENILSYEIGGELYTTNLRPVSIRGIPTKIGITSGDQSFSLSTTNTNERIFFNDDNANNRLVADSSQNRDTSFDFIYSQVSKVSEYNINWVTHSEILYPKIDKEFSSGSSRRTGYDI